MKAASWAALLLVLSVTGAHAEEDKAISLGLVNAWASNEQRTAICDCPFTTEWDGSNRQADTQQCTSPPDEEDLHSGEVEFLSVVGRGLAQRGFTAPEPMRGFARKTNIAEDPAVYIPVLKDILPLVGERRYGEAGGGTAVLGTCPLLVDYRTGIVEPTGKARGTIGRILLYAGDVWRIPLTPAEKVLFEKWSAEYPPDAEEKRRARNITRMSGIENPLFE